MHPGGSLLATLNRLGWFYTQKMWTRLPNHLIQRKGEAMKEYLILMAVIGVWILLQRVILPRMGIRT
jgi:flagellar biosynthesis regulator FlaF